MGGKCDWSGSGSRYRRPRTADPLEGLQSRGPDRAAIVSRERGEASGPPRRHGHTATVVALAALLLAGCSPGQQDPVVANLRQFYPPPPDDPPSYAAPPRSYVPDVIPRAQARAPVRAPYRPFVPVPDTSDEPVPIDPSCGHWWRLNNLWCGS
jgi:hypothetical protein